MKPLLSSRSTPLTLPGTMRLKWGAPAAARAVLRALAEHIEPFLWANPLVSREIEDQRAGAPVGTREGACAPPLLLNRSRLGAWSFPGVWCLALGAFLTG